MDQLFIVFAIIYESNPPISDDVDVNAPDFWSDEIYADIFYDAVKNLHKTVTFATDDAVPSSGDEDDSGRKNSSSVPLDSSKTTPPLSNHPGNQYSESSESEDDPELPEHATPGKCHQCGV